MTNLINITDINEVSHLTYKDELIPNHWYTFESEIKWHVYGKYSYCKPKLDGEDFSNNKKERIYTTRNMYNSKPNYFKMGLYWSGIEENSRSIYFDDISFYNKTERPVFISSNYNRQKKSFLSFCFFVKVLAELHNIKTVLT